MMDHVENLYSSAEMPQQIGSKEMFENAQAIENAGFRVVDEQTPFSTQQVEFGPIFRLAFELWKQNLGLLIAVVVIQVVISSVFWFAGNGVEWVMSQQDLPKLGLLLALITSVVDTVLGIYLGIGLIQIGLRIARGQSAEISDLFGGGSVLITAILVSIPVFVALVIGFLALIIPGIVLSLMIWPYYYFIADKKTSARGSVSAAISITSPNIATNIYMAITSFLLGILGSLALGIGLLFSTSLVAMIYSVGYLMMSGQLVPIEKVAK